MIEHYEHEKHYSLLASWWKARGWAPVPKEFLSNTGYVNGSAATFILGTNSALCFLEWTISDPNVDPKIRDEELNSLYSFCIEKAKSMGFQAIHTMSNSQKLIDRFKNHNFEETDQNMVSLIRSL